MPAWIVAALRLLAQGIGFGLGAEGVRGILTDDDIDQFGQPMLESGGAGGARIRIGGAHKLHHRFGHRRRRRRQALTSSDRADIAFIAGTISKKAAGDFAMQLAARRR